jgi:hypothetical protein
MPDIKIARRLPPIPSDPTPTKRQIEAELRKHPFEKSFPSEMQRKFAAFFWEAEQKRKFPDLFWHPFAPPLILYDAYLISDTSRRIGKKVKADAGHKCARCPKPVGRIEPKA